MDLKLLLDRSKLSKDNQIKIPKSKSEVNRWLILQKIFPNIELSDISTAEDSVILQKALMSNENVIDIGHAGTAMRFLTAYFATVPNKIVTLTGSERMQKRPIGKLVEALRTLGARIEYENIDGFPPIKIYGKELIGGKIQIDGSTSSQFITALLLIAPKLSQGLHLELTGEIVSKPYIEMTISMLQKIGVEANWTNNIIDIQQKDKIKNIKIIPESDWSSASYFYGIVSMVKELEITLSDFNSDSFQGDSRVVEIYKSFGVSTTFENNSITLKNTGNSVSLFEQNLNDVPDLAQTIVVTCLAKRIHCKLSGLQTLKIKETDRISALANELSKFNAKIKTTDSTIEIDPSDAIFNKEIKIKTYDDHRMAMAFSTLSTICPVIIENSEVVSKSFPDYFQQLKNIGFSATEI